MKSLCRLWFAFPGACVVGWIVFHATDTRTLAILLGLNWGIASLSINRFSARLCTDLVIAFCLIYPGASLVSAIKSSTRVAEMGINSTEGSWFHLAIVFLALDLVPFTLFRLWNNKPEVSKEFAGIAPVNINDIAENHIERGFGEMLIALKEAQRQKEAAQALVEMAHTSQIMVQYKRKLFRGLDKLRSKQLRKYRNPVERAEADAAMSEFMAEFIRMSDAAFDARNPSKWLRESLGAGQVHLETKQ